MRLTHLTIYPIKSLAGIPLDSARVSPQGFQHDRRWMLIHPNGQFITARQYPNLLLMQPRFEGHHLIISSPDSSVSPLWLPLTPQRTEMVEVTIFGDQVKAQLVSREVDAWFSEQLGISCQLVYLPDQSRRKVDPDYAEAEDMVSFADGFPYLIIGQSSLDHLNEKLDHPLSMRRFRPNLVFEGGVPHVEDEWKKIQIGPITFLPKKPCARCVMTTFDPDTAEKGKEPLATLSQYRQQGRKVMFGMNLLHRGEGEVKVGDHIQVLA
ncbi:MAG: MOSC N-terminal beta barrel domain-containing protein [Bacteroidota bacterium]